MSDFDWTELTCPMMCRQPNYPDDELVGDWTYSLHPCNELLFLTKTTDTSLHVGGECSDISSHWEVKCLGGHVLFTPNDEGNEIEIPFDFDEFARWHASLSVEATP